MSPPDAYLTTSVVWVFAEPEQLEGGQLRLDGARGRHLARVLRVRPGERGVAVCQGLAHRFTITGVEGDRVTARIDEVAPASGEPGRPLVLLQALLPQADFDAVLEAATQVGVTHFYPVRAARSIGRGGPERLARWRAILESAAEQSHRGAVPSIVGPLGLEDALGAVQGLRLLVLDPAAGASLPRPSPPDPVAIAVGPEGGWAPDELAAMTAAGGSRVTLGPRILRARLAGVVAAAILSSK